MNNYIFIRVVGKGSYGEVNLVKHKTDRKQYVIKKLNLTTSTKRERRAAEQEAQLLSELRHPNIVTYRESWEGDDYQLYIVMGFCEGGDLYHRLKQQKGELLPERQVVEWFVQIAMALQYLHERNILHRDLKTQNIFLTKTNIIKVGDLGIARVLENQNDMASTLIGTPYYMSPELFSNKPYNHKSDVWALGCCVYEISTLKHAFNAKDMNSLVYRIVEGKLPQMPSKYDPQLGDLIKSMLCKRPEDRPDVKRILRQPYIKRQIAMFLEATKEKTAKSRKKTVDGSGDCKTSSASSVASRQPKYERLPSSPQPEPIPRMKWQEEKLQQHRSRNGVSDHTPTPTPTPLLPPLKPSSSDALKASNASLATLSNINIDIPVQKDEDLCRQVQGPQSVMSQQRASNEAAHKEGKERGKQDPSPPLSPVWPPLKPVSCVGSRGGDEWKASNGLLDVHSKAAPHPGDAVFFIGDKQMSDVDEKDDTMELLREAGIHNPNLVVEKEGVFSISVLEKRSGHKPHTENITEVLETDMDNKNDTVTLPKGTPTQHHPSDIQESLDSTEKLLEPLPPVLVAAHRPLPAPPVENITVQEKKRSKRTTESKKTSVTAPTSTSVSASKDSFLPLPQDRPLSARERRRLRQSQESVCQSGINAVRRSSYDITSTKAKPHNTPVSRSVSDSSEISSKQERIPERRSDEDECSSSTSSTERSEVDCRERRAESNDIRDLVHMMTQTLRMDGGNGVCDVDRRSTALPEFKLNRKYRDTLVLHGKAREQAEDWSLGEIPQGTSGPAKIRRAIEHLRTDVVKGLGVKLLDRVLEVMEEEDDAKRELCLREQMGDEKYEAYAVMVRQLKFFEDNAFKV
ncbi:serine/threonine-protein kinase Nek4 isoform X2 [Sphaeramia orbicularis]|uniref:serine/threonine-protein kinase Nek4 isoform X2 n=1 Tax=Sphaeramia orbicularis TaxID=375764 RepID=UPI00117C3A38|nr:serine/threonine-protein kinase Nek4 isoform X2 [Sphaeramia orbicularis]